MRDVVSYNVVDKEHSNPDAYDRKNEVHPVVLVCSYLDGKQILYYVYQRVKHKSCKGSKYAYKEGKDKDEFLVREMFLPPGEDTI